MLSVVMLSEIMLNGILLNVVMLSVVMVTVVLLSVVAPHFNRVILKYLLCFRNKKDKFCTIKLFTLVITIVAGKPY